MTIELTNDEAVAVRTLIEKANWPGATAEAVVALKTKFVVVKGESKVEGETPVVEEGKKGE